MNLTSLKFKSFVLQKAFSSDSATADWKKTVADATSNKDQYPEYIENSKLNSKKKIETGQKVLFNILLFNIYLT